MRPPFLHFFSFFNKTLAFIASELSCRILLQDNLSFACPIFGLLSFGIFTRQKSSRSWTWPPPLHPAQKHWVLPWRVTELMSWFYFARSSQFSFYSSSPIPYFILCVLLSNPHPPLFLFLSHWMGVHSSPISKLRGLACTCAFWLMALPCYSRETLATPCESPLLPLGSGSIPFLLTRLFHFFFSHLSLALLVTLSPVVHFCPALKLVLESSRKETQMFHTPF